MGKELMMQEIFLKFKTTSDIKIHKRSFAWRLINFNKLYFSNLSLSDDGKEISFSSEINAELTREEILKFVYNSNLTTGEGIDAKFIPFELLELKEEREIYS